MKDSLTEDRDGSDVLVQEIPDGIVAFRLVQNNPPIELDFESHYERGKVPTPGKPYHSYAWFGVSLFEDRSRVERMVKSAHNRGEQAWTAEIRFVAETGLYGVYNGRTTHIEAFAYPHEMLRLVDNVV